MNPILSKGDTTRSAKNLADLQFFPLIKFYHFHQNIIIDLDLKFLTPFSGSFFYFATCNFWNFVASLLF